VREKGKRKNQNRKKDPAQKRVGVYDGAIEDDEKLGNRWKLKCNQTFEMNPTEKRKIQKKVKKEKSF